MGGEEREEGRGGERRRLAEKDIERDGGGGQRENRGRESERGREAKLSLLQQATPTWLLLGNHWRV